MPNGAKRWCFTLHNYDDEDELCLKKLADEQDPVYMIYGHEVCPTTNREHLQGFIHFRKKFTMNQIKKLVSRNDIHLEIAKADDKDNEVYCSKDGDDVFTYGEPRVKHLAISMDEYALMDDEEAEERCPGRDMMWRKKKNDWRSMRYKPYSGPRNVIWLYGPSGTGKTRAAHGCPGVSAPDFASGFFNGLQSTATLLIDEVDKVGLPLQTFLRIADRYPTTLNVKGGCLPHTADTVIFTSTCSPEVVWAGSDDYLTQVERRITHCIYTGVPGWDDELFWN